MTDPSSPSAFHRGLRSGILLAPMVVPFGILFGVVGTEAGLNIYEVLAFSVLVIAGAAQFTAVQLLSENTPTLMILLASLMVNMRMAMYSASVTPHFGAAPLRTRIAVAYLLIDQSYAESMLEFERHPNMTLREKLLFYFAMMIFIAPSWYIFTLVGALVGQAIPAELGLDFAAPICFIAMVTVGLRSLPHITAAFTGIVLGLALAWMPFSLGLSVAAIGAMIVGAQTEQWMQRQKTWS